MKLLQLLLLAMLPGIPLFAQHHTISRVLITKAGAKPVTVQLTATGPGTCYLTLTVKDSTPKTDTIYDLTPSTLHAFVATSMGDSLIAHLFDDGYIDKLDEMVPLTHIIMTTFNADDRSGIRSTFAFKDSIKVYYSVSNADTGKYHFDYDYILRHGTVAPLEDVASSSPVNPHDTQPVEVSLTTSTPVIPDLHANNLRLPVTNGHTRMELPTVALPGSAPDRASYVNERAAIQQDSHNYNVLILLTNDSIATTNFALTRLQIVKDTPGIKILTRQLADLNARITQYKQQIANNDTYEQYLTQRINSLQPAVSIADTNVNVLKGRLFRKQQHITNIELGTVYIDSVEMVVDNGYIKDLKLNLADSMRFHNNYGGEKMPLSLLGIRPEQYYNVSIDLRSVTFADLQLSRFLALRYNKHLSARSSLCYWIPLGGLIHYTPPKDSTLTDLFVPQRQRIFYTKGGEKTTTPEESINYIFKVNLFSDLVGTQQDQPNGLIQLEASLFANLHTRHSPTQFHIVQQSWFDHFEVKMRIAKIEQKLKALDLYQQVTPKDTFEYAYNFQLWQYANLDFQTRLNILTMGDYANELKWYAGAGFLRTTVSDSSIARQDTIVTIIPRQTNVISARFMTFLSYKVKLSSNFGAEVATEFSILKLLDNTIRQSSGYLDPKQPNNSYTQYHGLQNLIFSPQVQVYYHASRDENQRVYFRAILNKDLGTRGNVFYNLQVGYSSDVSKFLNFKNN